MSFRHSHFVSTTSLCWVVFWLAGVSEARGQKLDASAATSKVPILDTVIRSWPVDPAMTLTQELAIWKALCQPYTPNAAEIPIDQWVDSVASICPMQIDRTALEGVGLTTETPITFRLDTPPRSLLVHLLSALEDLECVVEIRHGIVRITTQDRADERLPIRIYDISTLLEEYQGREKLAAINVLMKTIQNVIAPDDWEELGGMSVMQIFPMSNKQLLCVAAKTQTHWQLQSFLDRLQRAGGEQPVPKSAVPRRSPKPQLKPQPKPEFLEPHRESEAELPRFRPE